MRPFGVVRWITLGALFAAPFIVLVVDPSLLFPYVAARGFGFRMLAEVAFVGLALLALADPRYRPPRSPIAVLFGIFVGWMALADAFAVDPHTAFWGNLERMEGWASLAHLFAFFVAAAGVLGAERLWRRWWLTFAAASAMVCGYGLLQLAGLARVARESTRIDALSGNPEFLGGYLLFAIAATVWLAGELHGRLWRLGLFALAGLQVFVLLQSGTRGALVGLVAAILLCGLAGAALAGRPGRWLALAGLAGVGGLGAGLVWLRATGIFADHPILGRYVHMGGGDLETRFSLWRMAWEGFLARPLTGWGHEGYKHVFNGFYEPALAAQEPWFDRAHNLYLDALVAGGAPALGLFIALLVAAAVSIWRAPFTRAGRLALLGGLAAYAVQGLVVFDSLMTYLPLAALLAMVHAARPAMEPAPLPRRIGWRVVSGAAAALAATAWLVNGPTAQASRNVVRALAPADGGPVRLGYLRRAADAPGFAAAEVRQRLARTAIVVAGAADAPEPDRTLFLDYAIAEARRGLDDAPHDVVLRLELARLYRALGLEDEARAQIAAALADAPRNPQLLEARSRLAVRRP